MFNNQPETSEQFHARQALEQRERMKQHFAANPFIAPSWNEVFGDVAKEAQQKRDEEEAQRRQNDPYSWEKRMDLNLLPPNDPLRVAAKKQRFEGGASS